MSTGPDVAARPLGPPRPRRRVNPPAVVVLTLVWVLLWDEVSLFIVLTGALLAVGVGLVFPLPPIDLHGRFRPVQGARLLVRLLVDAFRASVDVVALAFRFGTTPRSSIVRVQLRSRSDLYLTQTAELVSLVPGTIVLEVHRADQHPVPARARGHRRRGHRDRRRGGARGRGAGAADVRVGGRGGRAGRGPAAARRPTSTERRPDGRHGRDGDGRPPGR